MNNYRDHNARPRFEHPELLVLTRGRQQAAVAVQRDAVDHVWMPVDHVDRLAPGYVPDDHQVIEAGAEEHVLCYRMPFYVGDATLVSLKLYQPVGQVSGEATVGNVPQLDLALKEVRKMLNSW